MKTFNKTVLTLLALAAAAACGRKESYDLNPFVTFSTLSASLNETVGTHTIPVTLYNPTGSEAKVTVKIVNGTASAGVNCNLVEPGTGVLTFGPGETTKDIVVGIVNDDGYTGNLDFKVVLEPVGSEVSVGSYNAYSITIIDKDHPLVAAGVAGTYTVEQTGLTSSAGATQDYTFEMHLTTDANDITKVWCDGIIYMAVAYGSNGNFSVYGIVSDDYLKITFPQGQAIGYSLGYGTMYFYGGFSNWNSAHTTQGYYIYDGDYVEFTRESVSSKVWTCTDGLGVIDQYVWPSRGGFILGEADGCKTTWTRK